MQEEGFSYKKWLFLILSHWPLFVITISMALLFSFLMKRYVVRVYSVRASVLIKMTQNDNFPLMANYNNYKNTIKINNEINIVKSYSTIEKTIQGLDFGVNYYLEGNFRKSEIYPNTAFKVFPDTSSEKMYINQELILTPLENNRFSLNFYNDPNLIDPKPVFGKFNEVVDFNGMRLVIYKINDQALDLMRDSKILFQINNIPFMINDYRWRLGVNPLDKEGSILNIYLSSVNPAKDIAFLNKLSEIYVLSSLDDKNITTSKSIEFINSQLNIMQDTISKYAYGLEYYRRKFKVNDITLQASKSYEEIGVLERERAEYYFRLKYFNYLKDYIKNRDSYGDIIMPANVGVDDENMSSLVKKIVELNMQKKLILKTESAKESPFISENGRQIEEYKKTLYENIRNIEKTNQIFIDNLNDRINQMVENSGQLSNAEREFSHLKQMYEIYRQVYSFLLQKKADAGINRASNVPDIKIIDYATISGPPTPDFEKIQTMALLIALGFPIGFIFLKDYFNTKIIFKDDILKFSNIPFLGIIGHNVKDTLSVIESPKSSLAESFRSIRSNLLFLNPDKTNQIFLLTSSTSGEGKSFCSMNIGAVFAISGKSTLLIGADMRKPKLYEELNLKNESGLSNFLSGSAELDDVIQKTKIENLDFISSGVIPPNPVELIMGQRMENLIVELRKRYDYIVIDTPPIGLVIDAFVMMKYSDTNIYVVRHNYSKKQSLLEINESYRDGKFSNLNLVLNDVRTNGIYGYGYGYGYGNTNYGYGYYSDSDTLSKRNFSFIDNMKGWFKNFSS